jgi:hypothetical protein
MEGVSMSGARTNSGRQGAGVALDEPLLDCEAAAVLLNVRVSWVRDAARQGHLPCLRVACTERFMTGPDNDRFRDLMDLLLLRGLLTEADLPRVRAACARIFESRDKHAWPPTVTVYESWREPYKAMVRETHFEVQTVEDAAALVHEMIAEIDASA